jgi:hypothetical protein
MLINQLELMHRSVFTHLIGPLARWRSLTSSTIGPDKIRSWLWSAE